MKNLNLFTPQKGFTLAEMLVVIMIISIVAMSAIPFAHKRVRILKGKSTHGKYECYYGADGKLYEKEWRNSLKTRDIEHAEGETCSFNPPTDATYFIVQAIGAGGGGAWAGAINNTPTTDTHTGNLVVPINGDAVYADNHSPIPTWIDSLLNNDSSSFWINITVYGGGGGGGNGNRSTPTWNAASSPPSSEAACIANNPVGQRVMDNDVNYCKWTANYYSGQPGGKGGSASSGSIRILASKTINAQTGNGGGAATDGGNGTVTTTSGGVTTTLATALGGGAGSSATTSGHGVSAGVNRGNALGGTGGAGGAGMDFGAGADWPATNEPGSSSYIEAGRSGSTVGLTFTSSSVGADKQKFPYQFSYQKKDMPYGIGGSAGFYNNMFFRKLASDLIIKPGKGGLAGTSESDYNGDSTKGDGKAGESSTISVMVAGVEKILFEAKGGKAGVSQFTLTGVDLYKAYTSSSYRDSLGSTVATNVKKYRSPSYEFRESAGQFEIYGGKGYEGQSVFLRGELADDTAAIKFGTGGDGGGSYTGLNYSMTKRFNNVDYVAGNFITTGSPSTSLTGDSYEGSPGSGGAIVIIW